MEPRVYLSKGMVTMLQEPELHAVLAHEEAHVTRRDNLRNLMLRLVTALGQSKPLALTAALQPFNGQHIEQRIQAMISLADLFHHGLEWLSS